ncbi:MAG: hypothetical protein Q7S57_05455 [bacterium]|nr:hypothetical protein [bacterium]
MAEIFYRTDLKRFEPILGELYLVMMVTGDKPRLHLAYYGKKGKYVGRKGLAIIDDFVASEFRLDGSGIFHTIRNIERGTSVVAVQKASDNAILAFVRLWKEGPDDFLRYVETWTKKGGLKAGEIKRVLLIAREEVRRQQLYGHMR